MMKNNALPVVNWGQVKREYVSHLRRLLGILVSVAFYNVDKEKIHLTDRNLGADVVIIHNSYMILLAFPAANITTRAYNQKLEMQHKTWSLLTLTSELNF